MRYKIINHTDLTMMQKDTINALECACKRMDLLNELLDMFSTRTDEMSTDLKCDFVRLIVKHSGGTSDDNCGNTTDTE